MKWAIQYNRKKADDPSEYINGTNPLLFHINAQGGSDNWTPLHCAVSDGNATMAALLLKAGADVYARARDNRRPIDVMVNRNVPVLKLLKKYEITFY